MEVLESHLDTQSDEFKANAAHHRALAADLKRRLESVKQGGGPELVKKHTARGKLFVRERIACSTRARPSSSFRRSPRTASTATTRRPPASSPAWASCAGGR